MTLAYTRGGSIDVLDSASALTRTHSAQEQYPDTPSARLETARQLYDLFLVNVGELSSDGAVSENSLVRLSTTRSATLTSVRVLAAAKQIAARKAYNDPKNDKQKLFGRGGG
eukprot:IDg18715t1